MQSSISSPSAVETAIQLRIGAMLWTATGLDEQQCAKLAEQIAETVHELEARADRAALPVEPRRIPQAA